MRTHNVAVIPGDGIGTEVIGAPSGTWIKASTFLKVALKN